MKQPRAIGIVTVGAAFLFGCASIVGITDLPSDGGSSGSSSSGTSSGGLAEGQACPTGDGCQPGLTCLGACRTPCTTVGATCANDGVCEEFGSTFLCTIPCIPTPDSCGAGLACEVGILDGTSTALSDCEPPGVIAASQPCTSYDQCVAGYTCPNAAEASPTCTLWCTGTTCSNGSACNQYVRFNGVYYGYCTR